MKRMAHVLLRPRKTLQDREALPPNVRSELLDGELYVTPSPSSQHQVVLLAIARRLADHVDDAKWGTILVAPLDVHLPSGDLAQPDIMLVRHDAACEVRQHVHGAPTVVIEVLSPTHPERDLVVKRQRYAKAGILEYWIVDADPQGIQILALDGVEYRAVGWFTEDATLRSPSLPDLSMSAAQAFPVR